MQQFRYGGHLFFQILNRFLEPARNNPFAPSEIPIRFRVLDLRAGNSSRFVGMTFDRLTASPMA